MKLDKDYYLKLGAVRYITLMGGMIFGGTIFAVILVSSYFNGEHSFSADRLFFLLLGSVFAGLCFGTMMWFLSFAKHEKK
jgi:hypothetical protein